MEFLKDLLNLLSKQDKAPAVQEKNNYNVSDRSKTSPALAKMRKRIAWQAGLAVLTIVLTVVLVFAMTSAWYTNIVQTSGLVFQAEAWGFEGQITLNTDPIVAGPGDDGAIHLEVENESADISAVSVNISKARMVEEMQKRLYFYVETQQVRNGETVERVYLNNQDSYTYMLFSESTLTLTDTVHNDAPLKWQWVYDVLGYYVLGMPNADKTDITEIEYLRPIEYNYDEATTTFETSADNVLTMELKTVDGEMTVDEFLVELSKTDGYEGTINPDHQLECGYYPVDVDEDGYGVYAYLCNYAEIEMATQYDTALGKAAAEGTQTSYEAQLTISAQKNKNNIVTAASLAAVEQAITLGTGDVIQLTNDITIAEGYSLSIPEGKRVILDLNEHEIVSQSSAITIDADPGSSLTMMNGKVTGPGEAGYAVYASGAEVVFSNVDVTDFKYGVYVADDEGNTGLDSKIRLVDSKISASYNAIMLKGNGTSSGQLTQLVVENCEITSDGIAISGNGTSTGIGKWGTDMQIISSKVTSNPDLVTVGIYHPQKDSTLTIYDSEISGYTSLIIKGGDVSIVDSVITGKGAQLAPGFYGSGSADTGDAVYIETNYGYEILLEISGESILTSDYSYSLQVYEADATNVAVKIHSGTFDEAQPAAYIAEGSVQEGSTVRTVN